MFATMYDHFKKSTGGLPDSEFVKKTLSLIVEDGQYRQRHSAYPQAGAVMEKKARSYFSQNAAVARTALFKDVLRHFSWRDIAAFGGETFDKAWLIVQYADHDLPLQTQALAAIKDLYEEGKCDPSCYAYLYDRVAVNSQNPQRYGTLFSKPKTLELYPVEDLENLDHRRKEVHLCSIAEYKRQIAKMYKGAADSPF